MRFKDRIDAGEQLAEALRKYAKRGTVVYAIPRGGVVVGAVVADRLKAPFDLVIARKIGHPSAPEYAIAAVTEKGDVVANESEVARVDAGWFRREVENQRMEAKRRREAYLGDTPPLLVKGGTAIIVDDGLATGLTMRAAVSEMVRREPKKIVIAIPAAPAETLGEIARFVDRVVCLYSPPGPFGAVGEYYDSFPQVTDEEVVALLRPKRSP